MKSVSRCRRLATYRKIPPGSYQHIRDELDEYGLRRAVHSKGPGTTLPTIGIACRDKSRSRNTDVSVSGVVFWCYAALWSFVEVIYITGAIPLTMKHPDWQACCFCKRLYNGIKRPIPQCGLSQQLYLPIKSTSKILHGRPPTIQRPGMMRGLTDHRLDCWMPHDSLPLSLRRGSSTNGDCLVGTLRRTKQVYAFTASHNVRHTIWAVFQDNCRLLSQQTIDGDQRCQVHAVNRTNAAVAL